MFDRIRALFMVSTFCLVFAGCDAAMLQRGRLPEPGTRSGSSSDLPDAEVVDLTLLKVSTGSPVAPAKTANAITARLANVEILDDSDAASSNAKSVKSVESLAVSQRDIHAVDCSKDRVTLAIQDHGAHESQTQNTSEEESVAIAGAIFHPGSYAFREGMLVSALVRSAGGFRLEANLRRAVIVRPLSIPAAFNVGERSSRPREITIPVDLGAILTGNKDADIPLNRFDTLKILSLQSSNESATVSIVGAVQKPGVYKLTANLTLGQLIRMAGGATADALADDSVITREKHSADDIRASSVTYKFRLSDIRQHLADYDLTLENHDQITINSAPSK